MRLKIGSRRSDLARLQAYQVGAALQSARPNLEIEFFFKESLGDKNLHDPLWKMPERGVFTEDFLGDLRSGEIDLVVHSWKDLPTEERPDTEIIATLPRADSRDLLLFRSDKIPQGSIAELNLLSSSPRREYNIGNCLPRLLPFSCQKINFHSVRGNVPTRVRKLFEGDSHGLIVAKAALDRLLTATQPEFLEMQKELRTQLARCRFMVLPLSYNPTAAAQGALAIEALTSRTDLHELCQKINCRVTAENAGIERSVLRSYGGGCHQKIGVSAQTLPMGRLLQVKGYVNGQVLERRDWISNIQLPPANSSTALWPPDAEIGLFDRSPIPHCQNPGNSLWITKANALPEAWKIDPTQLIWTSGLVTWEKLAKRGIWVNGSQESLGEEVPPLDALVPNARWTKLTHSSGYPSSNMTNLATYSLSPVPNSPAWSSTTHFYWSSASLYDEALRRDPTIATRFHACGAGNSYQILAKKIPGLAVFLSYKDWRTSICRT